MSKWRPVPFNCLYVIPDIHGQFDELRLILKRILPLRKSDGGQDRLVLLGDYIDRHKHGPEVIDYLIKLKAKYKDQLILLKGNHELMLMDAIKPYKTSAKYMMWMKNGGDQTLVRYLERAKQEVENPYLFPRFRLKDVVPHEHQAFISSLKSYYETDDYIFVHGGCDPTVELYEQYGYEYAWDRSLFNIVSADPGGPDSVEEWKKTVVTGHNGSTGHPFITNKFMMLDCSCADKLLAVELNSMEAFAAYRGNKRLIKVSLTEVSQ